MATSLAIGSLPPSPPASAQDSGSAPSREELEGLLEQRDRVIQDLLRRVEELERRQSPVGAAAPAPPPSTPRTAAAAAPAPSPARPGAAEPGRVVVDEEAAERALERTLVQTGVLLLPVGQAEITPSFSYTRSEELLSFQERDIRDAALGLRFGLPYDAQLELDLPYTFVDQSTETASGERNDSGRGWGDLDVGLAKTLAREEGWMPDLVGRVTWDTATGERSDDGVPLGGGTHELGFVLNATKRQDPLVFAGALGYTRQFEEDDVRSGDSIGYSLTAFLAASPETSLRFGISQSFVDEAEFDGNRIEGSDFVSASLNLGASTILGARTLLDVGAGIGLTDESPDFTIQVSLPFRFNLPLLN